MVAKAVPLWEGHIKIRIFRNWLFQRYDLPPGAALTASAIRYGELLRQEVRRRYKRTHIMVEVHPGDTPMLIDISDDHVDQKGIFETVSRISVDLVTKHRSEWIVMAGSDEEQRMIRIAKERQELAEQKRDPRITHLL